MRPISRLRSSAILSLARCFTLSLFNWPQAAMMSRPRGRHGEGLGGQGLSYKSCGGADRREDGEADGGGEPAHNLLAPAPGVMVAPSSTPEAAAMFKGYFCALITPFRIRERLIRRGLTKLPCANRS